MVGLHAEIDVFVIEERADGEPGGDEEDKAHGDLERDDEIPNTRVMAVRACRLTGGPKGLIGADVQGLRKGRERKCDGDERRNGEGEPEDVAVGSEAGIDARPASKQARGGNGEQPPEARTGDNDREAVECELAQDAY